MSERCFSGTNVFFATCFLCCLATTAVGDVVLESGFEPDSYSLVTTNPRVTGALPKGWEDDSAWAQVWMTAGPQIEDGVTFFRLDLTRREQGRGVVVHPLPEIRGETFYRLRFQARSRTRTPVQIELRMRPEPWTTYWRDMPELGPDWRTYTYDFRVGPKEKSVGFFIMLMNKGEFDLASLRLERQSRNEMIDEIRRRYPDGGPRNLLCNTRFPLGMQSGWSMDRFASDDLVIVEPDPETLGPSGSPALRLKPDGARWIQMPPFKPAWPFEKHTASVYVKGSGKGTLAVLADGEELGRTAFEVDTGRPWKRIAVTFQPTMLASVHWMRIEDGKGEFWIDAAQVNRGDAPMDYTPQMLAEVAMAVPASCQTAPARVQFEDEPAKLDVVVTGAPEGSLLQTKVVNIYEKEKTLPPVSLAGTFLESRQLDYGVFPETPYGPFRIEAWVADKDGHRISPYQELIVHRLRRPRYWGKDAPLSPFGVHTVSTRRHLLMAKAIGINWVRLHNVGTNYTGWNYVEPKPGVWTFHDEDVLRYRKYHLNILGIFSTTPPWARRPTVPSGHAGLYTQPRDVIEFGKYVRTVTKRYRSVIDAWDVWNEPWALRNWSVGHDPSRGAGRAGLVSSNDPPRDYAKLMRTAYENVKAVDPKATVLGFNSTCEGALGEGNYSGEEWTRRLAKYKALAYCDAIAYHQYSAVMNGFPGDEVQERYRRALGPILNAQGLAPKPVWMTEGEAVVRSLGNGFYHHTLTYEDDENVRDSANRTSRLVLSLLAQRVRKIFLYSMHCHYYFDRRGLFRSLVTEDGYLHPAADALSNLTWHLEDTRYEKTIRLVPGVYAFVFTGPRGKVAVLSRDPKRHVEYRLGASDQYEIRDMFGNLLPAGSELGDELVFLTVKPSGNLEDLLAPRRP